MRFKQGRDWTSITGHVPAFPARLRSNKEFCHKSKGDPAPPTRHSDHRFVPDFVVKLAKKCIKVSCTSHTVVSNTALINTWVCVLAFYSILAFSSIVQHSPTESFLSKSLESLFFLCRQVDGKAPCCSSPQLLATPAFKMTPVATIEAI